MGVPVSPKRGPRRHSHRRRLSRLRALSSSRWPSSLATGMEEIVSQARLGTDLDDGEDVSEVEALDLMGLEWMGALQLAQH